LSILGLFLFVFVNLNAFMAAWSQQVQLVVYLGDKITENSLPENEWQGFKQI